MAGLSSLTTDYWLLRELRENKLTSDW
jgi:hypothetical protein